MNEEWFSLDELTTRLAALVWVEQRLAEVLAGWAATTPEPAAAVAFARAGAHHHWHAELLIDVLPTSPQLVAHERVVAPTAGWKRAVDQLVAISETQARLTSIAKVIAPWLAREVGALTDLANPLSDRDHARLLGFVSLDHQNDHDEIDDLLADSQQGTVDLGGRREIADIDLG